MSTVAGTVYSETGSLASGGSMKNVDFAPDADLFFGGKIGTFAPDADLILGKNSTYAPSAKLAGSKNTLLESGSIMGRDVTQADFILGDGSTVYNSAPEEMFDLLSDVFEGYRDQSDFVFSQVQSLQEGADDRADRAVDLIESEAAIMGDTMKFIKKAAPFALGGGLLWIVGKKVLS